MAAHALTQAQKDSLTDAINLMVKEQARETPFDATVIEVVGRVAASTGFMGTGAFNEAMLNNPFSTLLRFLVYVGGP
jgi:hypothetical protein